MLSKDDRVEIVQLYFNNNSIRQVRDLFAAKYPEKKIPSISTIHKIIKKFQTGGCVVQEQTELIRSSKVLDEDMKLNILCFVEENPVVSLREVGKHFNISHGSVYKVLKEFNYKACQVQQQELNAEDREEAAGMAECIKIDRSPLK